MPLLATRRSWTLPVVAVAVIAAIVVAVVMATRGRDEPPPRARVYTEQSACLLAGSMGLADPTTIPVWAGMQDASIATSAKVSFLAVAGPVTTGNALTYAATLAQRHCGTIVAVGKPQVEAIQQLAQQYPDIHVIAIGAPTAAENTTAIPATPASELRTAVADAVTRFTDAE